MLKTGAHAGYWAIDPCKTAAELAARSPVVVTAMAAAPEDGAFEGRIADAAGLDITGAPARRAISRNARW